MNKDAFFLDLQFLCEHVYENPDKAVRRWSDVTCDDYQVPIALIIGFLFKGLIPGRPVTLPLNDSAEYKALIDIVQRSNLNVLLFIDRSDNSVRFCDGTPDNCILEVAEFVGGHTSGCT